jgi:hypothetical protein
VADLGTQLVGRLKQFDRRFGQFLSAMEEDTEVHFASLEARVASLSQAGDPAA